MVRRRDAGHPKLAHFLNDFDVEHCSGSISVFEAGRILKIEGQPKLGLARCSSQEDNRASYHPSYKQGTHGLVRLREECRHKRVQRNLILISSMQKAAQTNALGASV